MVTTTENVTITPGGTAIIGRGVSIAITDEAAVLGAETVDAVNAGSTVIDAIAGLGGGGPEGTSDYGKLTGALDGLTSSERSVVNDLLAQGKNVEIVPRSNIPGVKTPDFKVDGVLTELKTLNGTSLNTPVSKIQDAFNQGAKSVIIDGRSVALTSGQANTILIRIQGIYKNGIPGRIEIWTSDGDIILP